MSQADLLRSRRLIRYVGRMFHILPLLIFAKTSRKRMGVEFMSTLTKVSVTELIIPVSLYLFLQGKRCCWSIYYMGSKDCQEEQLRCWHNLQWNTPVRCTGQAPKLGKTQEKMREPQEPTACMTRTEITWVGPGAMAAKPPHSSTREPCYPPSRKPWSL